MANECARKTFQGTYDFSGAVGEGAITVGAAILGDPESKEKLENAAKAVGNAAHEMALFLPPSSDLQWAHPDAYREMQDAHQKHIQAIVNGVADALRNRWSNFEKASDDEKQREILSLGVDVVGAIMLQAGISMVGGIAKVAGRKKGPFPTQEEMKCQRTST